MHPLAGAIDTPLPTPPERTHLMLGSKAAWVEPAIGPRDRQFTEYPNESIAEWHERLGLVSRRERARLRPAAPHLSVRHSVRFQRGAVAPTLEVS